MSGYLNFPSQTTPGFHKSSKSLTPAELHKTAPSATGPQNFNMTASN